MPQPPQVIQVQQPSGQPPQVIQVGGPRRHHRPSSIESHSRPFPIRVSPGPSPTQFIPRPRSPGSPPIIVQGPATPTMYPSVLRRSSSSLGSQDTGSVRMYDLESDELFTSKSTILDVEMVSGKSFPTLDFKKVKTLGSHRKIIHEWAFRSRSRTKVISRI